MTLRRISVILVLCCAWMLSAPAAERYMAVDDIKPGMVGIGRTVFRGDTLEDFTVHILGVLRNTIAPKRDLILARLEGGPLAKTGVIAGMSGSPVYIDGRLIGAVSYSLGSFTTEPIAGITPIAEMIDASRQPGPRQPAVPVPVPAFITADAFLQAQRGRPSPVTGFASALSDVRALHPGALDPGVATALRPIATPLVLNGISADAAAPLLDALTRAAFVTTPAAGGAGQAATAARPKLRPGDAVGVNLISGDYNIGATGTVTDVAGDTVYAFGHPFFGLGPTRLPMTTAFVHTILPSLMSSTKVASTGEIIGAFTQDRATVLAGTLGKGPDTIPVTMSMTTPGGGRRELHFSIIDDPFFTPLLGFVAVGSALSTYERDLGLNTYAVRGRVALRGYDAVAFDDVFTGDGAATGAASALSVPLAALVTNDRQPVRIEGITLDITTAERARVSSIERVWVDAVDVRPGRPLALKILLRPYRGADEIRTVMTEIPISATGPLTIVVADGARITQFEQRDGRTPAAASSVPQLVSQINRVKRNNCVYVRIYARDAGAMVGGEPLPALPNSVLAVIEGDRAASGTSSISSAVVGTWDIPVDHAVTGMRTLTITPVPYARLP